MRIRHVHVSILNRYQWQSGEMCIRRGSLGNGNAGSSLTQALLFKHLNYPLIPLINSRTSMSLSHKLVHVIGGTNAQGIPVIKCKNLSYKYKWKILTFRVALTKDGKYAIRVLTRSASHARGSELTSLPNVSFYVGDPHNEDDLHEAFKGVDYAFVNLNGFAIGRRRRYFGE